LSDDTNDLDDEFPFGEGRAETSTHVTCPYCSETVEISVDPGSGSVQDYVEDCEVCCNPWQVNVRFIDGVPSVDISALEE
jgi:hypothetical protein